jgi:hypothetical protein
MNQATADERQIFERGLKLVSKVRPKVAIACTKDRQGRPGRRDKPIVYLEVLRVLVPEGVDFGIERR